MRVQRQKEAVLLAFSVSECRLLLRILKQLHASYEIDPREVDPRAAAVWYSQQGCASAKMSDAETQEWIEHLHSIKKSASSRFAHWTEQLTDPEARLPMLKLSIEETSTLMVALNDYRLWTAACHDIGEKEMAAYSPTALIKLPAAQREALFEVHFLAWIVEEIVQALQEA